MEIQEVQKPDIIISYCLGKSPIANIQAKTEHGVFALSDILGSQCSGIVINRGRLKRAKKALLEKGCIIKSLGFRTHFFDKT